MLDMFLYGRLGHFKELDEGYRLSETWITDETSREILLDIFHEVVIGILAIIHNIGVASRAELTQTEH